MNSEELELSLRTEFENYLKGFRAEMRQEAAELHSKIEAEFDKHRSQFDEAFQAHTARFDSEHQFDEAFTGSVVEHLRLARDEGARLTANALAEAEDMEREAQAAMPPAAPEPPDFSGIRDAINDISRQDSQSAILKSLVTHAEQYAPRGAFFIIKNEKFLGWKVFGGDGDADDMVVRDIHFPVSSDSILGAAVRSLETAHGSYGAHADNSVFLEPINYGEPDRMYAIPLVARGRGVAVLYADYGTGGVTINIEALETLVRIAALTVELLASSQTAKAENREVGPADFEQTASEHTPDATHEHVDEPQHEYARETEHQHVEETQHEHVEEPRHEHVEEAPQQESVEEARPETGGWERPENVFEQPAFADEAQPETFEQAQAESFDEAPSHEEFVSHDESHEVERAGDAYDASPSDESQTSEFAFSESFPAEDSHAEESPFGHRAEPETATEVDLEATVPGFTMPGSDAPGIDEQIRGFEPETETATSDFHAGDDSGEVVFDSGGSIESAVMENSPFSTTAEFEPASALVGGAMPQATETAVEVSPANVGRTRLSDRPVDLPIDVAEDERRLHNDARRFARLLVSEIKLYNEKKVQEGRQARDLYERLREAIDRSREMYDKRVQPPVAAKFDYFHYELVNALADGEAERLGPGYPGSTI